MGGAFRHQSGRGRRGRDHGRTVGDGFDVDGAHRVSVPRGRHRDRGHRDGVGHGTRYRIDHGCAASCPGRRWFGLNDATREFGGALGVAIIGSVASSLFAGRLHPFLAPVPAPAAAKAKASVGAAVTVGGHTPGPVGQMLIDGARQAFVSGVERDVLVAVAARSLCSAPSSPSGSCPPGLPAR